MLEAGDAVERYVVERLLGEGGMADVYRVRHRTLQSPMALKVLRVNARSIQERLVQEGKLQAQLRHPNIVEVRDVLDVGGFPALLLELVEGPTLDELMRDRRLPLEEAEEIFRGILAAVEHAHHLGLVHRDLKPGNVLLAPLPGGHWTPKVTDFGLARVIQDEDPGMRRTRSGIAMGTPRYMSPEQIRDAKGVDQRTDIFALGAILYELVCGEAAFERSDIAAIFNATLSGSYRPPGELAPGVPERVLRAIDGALRTRKEHRLQDCAALREVLDGRVVPSPAPRSAEPTMGPDDGLAPRRSTPTSAPSLDASQVETRGTLPPPGGRGLVGAIVLAGASIGGAVLLAAAGLGWLWLSSRTPEPPAAAPIAATPSPTEKAPPESAAPALDPVAADEPAARTAPPVKTPAPATEKAAEPPTEPPPHPEAAEPSPPPEARVAPVEAPPAEPDPAPTAAGEATVRWSGDATRVWLHNASGTHPARGGVPAGEWQVLADFGDGARTPAGELSLHEGESVRLTCRKAFRRCAR
jgi:serine/threonine-protein kinase